MWRAHLVIYIDQIGADWYITEIRDFEIFLFFSSGAELEWKEPLDFWYFVLDKPKSYFLAMEIQIQLGSAEQSA